MNETVEVECYSGYTYAQEPRAVEWKGQRYEVKRIVKRWRTPQGPHFRVEVAGISNLPWPTRQGRKSPMSRLVDLTYLEIEDKWTMAVPKLIQEDQR
ncbi:MAG: hypothetical protein P8186_32525 [Anaerolineae bacterium]|jgi:hypothetical protein